MNYLKKFELEFDQLLGTNTPDVDIVAWASEQMLASYRNGLKAGRKGVEVKRDGKSRSRYAPLESLPKER
jgi:hypothetical protein